MNEGSPIALRRSPRLIAFAKVLACYAILWPLVSALFAYLLSLGWGPPSVPPPKNEYSLVLALLVAPIALRSIFTGPDLLAPTIGAAIGPAFILGIFFGAARARSFAISWWVACLFGAITAAASMLIETPWEAWSLWIRPGAPLAMQELVRSPRAMMAMLAGAIGSLVCSWLTRNIVLRPHFSPPLDGEGSGVG